jgi:hypothetical protein
LTRPPRHPPLATRGETLAPPATGPLLPHSSCRRPLPRWWQASSPKGGGDLRLQFIVELGRRGGGPGQVEVAPDERPSVRRTSGACGGGGGKLAGARWPGVVVATAAQAAGPNLGFWAAAALRRLWWQAAARPGWPASCARWWELVGLRAAVAPVCWSGGSRLGLVAGFSAA